MTPTRRLLAAAGLSLALLAPTTGHAAPMAAPTTARTTAPAAVPAFAPALAPATVQDGQKPPATLAEAAATNPLAGRRLGVYQGNQMPETVAYAKATGEKRTLLGKIANRPRVKWYGAWLSPAQVKDRIRSYIAASQKGDPNVVVQLAVFRLWPKGEKAKNEPLTAAQQTEYKRWIDAVAEAVGSTRTAIVLEPDLAVAYNGWRPEVRLALARYAAQKLGPLPNTSVYLEASDADWLSVDRAVTMLKAAGIQYVRGFALGATHYWANGAQRTYARKISDALAAQGYGRKTAVIDSADNARPFTYKQYYAEHPTGWFDNAETCTSTTDTSCVTLGLPPRAETTNPVVDGYLWFGRPWLYAQADPYQEVRALQVARTTPFK